MTRWTWWKASFSKFIFYFFSLWQFKCIAFPETYFISFIIIIIFLINTTSFIREAPPKILNFIIGIITFIYSIIILFTIIYTLLFLYIFKSFFFTFIITCTLSYIIFYIIIGVTSSLSFIAYIIFFIFIFCTYALTWFITNVWIVISRIFIITFSIFANSARTFIAVIIMI